MMGVIQTIAANGDFWAKHARVLDACAHHNKYPKLNGQFILYQLLE
jgi:hypothetical protein